MSSKPSTRISSASIQRSLPRHYAVWVQFLSLAAFLWAFLGWLNESWLFWFDNPIWLNRYTEYAIILTFGLWRIHSEKRNPYTRKRLIVLISCVTVLWWLIPWLLPFTEPYVWFLGREPVFPDLHTPGTLTFFLTLAAVFLFGRRVICGWNCPCVAIRETVGFPFRNKTFRGEWAWRLRHTKWIYFILYLAAMAAVLSPLNSWSASYLGVFALLVIIPYFISMLFSPLTGNRAYCRYLCPYGATFGLLNRAGFFRIDYNTKTCTECELCTKVCDMGIPVMHLGKEGGAVDSADCMGCGRCVSECPTGSLAFHDVRNLLRPAFHQDRDRLWKLADWSLRPVRLRAALLAIVLAVVLVAAWRFSSQVGTHLELVAGLCIR